MKKMIMLGLGVLLLGGVAVAADTKVATTAAAVTVPCNGAGTGKQTGKCFNFVDANKDALCDRFVDANKDGVNDNAGRHNGNKRGNKGHRGCCR